MKSLLRIRIFFSIILLTGLFVTQDVGATQSTSEKPYNGKVSVKIAHSTIRIYVPFKQSLEDFTSACEEVYKGLLTGSQNGLLEEARRYREDKSVFKAFIFNGKKVKNMEELGNACNNSSKSCVVHAVPILAFKMKAQ
jgi:hypothetical protein